MIVVGWVVEWKGDDDGGVWVCGCVAWVWEVRMRGASPRSGAFWCERSGREERREEPGRLVHAWCDLLRITTLSRFLRVSPLHSTRHPVPPPPGQRAGVRAKDRRKGSRSRPKAGE